MVPKSLDPVTMRRSSESETPPLSLSLILKRARVLLETKDRAMPTGLTTDDSTFMGGTKIQATVSAFITLMDLGRSSTKKRFMPVKTTAPHVSPLGPKIDLARCMNSVVA